MIGGGMSICNKELILCNPIPIHCTCCVISLTEMKEEQYNTAWV